MTSPTPIQKPRRRSFLDHGGPNSINNFASSYTRAQSYVGLSLLEDADAQDDVSPCLSPVLPIHRSDGTRDGYFADQPRSSPNPTQGYDHLDTYNFPNAQRINENTPLDQRDASRRSLRSASGSIYSIGHAGKSTAAQTVFNSLNTLMGIAIFSLSFGFRLSGWVLGILILLFCSVTTNLTAKVLGAVLKKYPHLQTYGDIAHMYGGSRMQLLAIVTFTLDLTGAALSLILLFADSFKLLLPGFDIRFFKAVIVLITFFMSFMPLNVLSMVSLTGIMSTVSILVVIVTSGFIVDKGSNGSLLSPASTNLWPSSLLEALLSIGIFMAPWGGHPVFPELYKDMRHPKKYNTCCNITFMSCLKLDLLVAIVGYLMFGNTVEDSLTKSLMGNRDLPYFMNPLLCVFLGLLPISKMSLVVQPIISLYENYFRMNDTSVLTYKHGRRYRPITTKKVIARVVFMGLLFILSLVFTSFGKVVAFLGSAICCTICITLPLMFYAKFFAEELSTFEKLLIRLGVIVGFAGAVFGTYASFVYETS